MAPHYSRTNTSDPGTRAPAAARTPLVGRRPRRINKVVVVCAAASVFALTALTAIAPPPGSSFAAQGTPAELQTLAVSGGVAGASVFRDDYTATSGLQTFLRGTTNHDWAKLVLFFGGFPVTDSNVTVMLRWMRQENGPDDWWLRNNPLNNGWGSGGGSGLGSYDNLVTAAQNVANALHGNSGYSAIVAGFASSAPTAQIEAAIWASPWASSHYANGSHWAYTPVPEYASPSGTWG